MKIALDWDDTVTRDPTLWRQFVEIALRRGHDVRIVTMRYERELEDVREMVLAWDVDHLPIIHTDRQQKRPYCAEHWSFFPDVWIDDSPEFIVSVAEARIFGASMGGADESD